MVRSREACLPRSKRESGEEKEEGNKKRPATAFELTTPPGKGKNAKSSEVNGEATTAPEATDEVSEQHVE